MKKHLLPTTDFAVAMDTAQNDTQYIKRQWTVNGHVNDPNAFYRTKELTFYWTPADDYGFNWGANVPMVWYGGNSYAPTSYSTSSNPRWAKISYTFPQTGAKASQSFLIGLDEDETLPVQLSSFTASMHQGGSVMLRWVTQTETNLLGYRVFRATSSAIGNALMLDAFVQGTNTSQAQTYIFVDREVFEPGTYYYWLQSLDMDGSSAYYGPVSISYAPGQPETPGVVLPAGFNLLYPNPFNPDLNIRYTIDTAGPAALDVYNLRGQLVRRLVDSNQDKGTHTVRWDGRDAKGSPVSSGMYHLILRSGGKTFSSRAMMMK